MGEFPQDLAARYEPVRSLASGGFATVWLATQRGLDRTVAVKLLHERVLERDTERERFVNEARITAGLSHPNIVKVLDFGAATGVPWIVYEYLPGASLADLLEQGKLSIAATLDAGAQVAGALAEAHQHGVLHRDVKPGNVLCAEPGLYKIGDFGLARLAEGGTALTATGVVVGTPAFFAPELLSGCEPGPATDLYALGISLYQLLVNDLPSLGVNAQELWAQAWDQRATPLPPLVARKVGQVVAGLLARDPAQRTPSAAEAHRQLAALAAAAEHANDAPAARTAVAAPPTPPASRTRAPSRPDRPRTVQPPTPLATKTRPPSRVWLALPLVTCVAAIGLSLRQPAPPPPRPSTTPAASASAPDRSHEVREAMRVLLDAVDHLDRVVVIRSVPGVIGENIRELTNRREVEPQVQKNTANARRLVRLVRETKFFGQEAEPVLRTVARAVGQSSLLTINSRDQGIQRQADQVLAEAEALAKEAPGSGFVGAGVNWIRAKHAGLLGRTGDASALRYLRAAAELLQAEPDPAWQASSDFADSMLAVVHAAHEHQKRIGGGALYANGDTSAERTSALDVLRAVQRCLDLKSWLSRQPDPFLNIVLGCAHDVLDDPGARAAERAEACRAAARTREAQPRPRTAQARSWDELGKLACPTDKR